MPQWTPSPLGRAFCMLPPRQCLPSQGRSIVEPAPFSAWESFYVIIGSSAAALTGLQFVVVVLGAEARSIGPEVGAFGTPTVVHFCAVLLMSAILSVPWRAVSHAGLSLAAVGVAGIVRTEEHTAEHHSPTYFLFRLLLFKKKKIKRTNSNIHYNMP